MVRSGSRVISANKWVVVGLLVALLLATGLRFYQLDAQSFWNDEGNSARLSERDLARILEGTASDIHPPLYYVLLRGWRELLGDDEFGLRSFSAFVGVLTVATVAALALRLRRKGWALALTAAFLAAINPALIYYSQETRMYALLALLSAVSTLCLLGWLQSRRGRGWMVAYVISAVAGLYTHYFFPAVLLVQGLVVLLAMWPVSAERVFGFVRPWRQTLKQGLLMAVVAFVLYLPWLPIFIRQAGGRSGERETLVAYIWQARSWLAFGSTLSAEALALPMLALSALMLIGLWFGRWRALVALLGTLTLVLFMFGVGTTQPAFLKFLNAAEPFFLLWLAFAGEGVLVTGYWLFKRLPFARKSPITNHQSPITNYHQSPISNLLALLAIPLLLILFSTTAESLHNLYHDPAYARADYRGMVARISAENHPNAGIILNAPNQWEVFTYYHTDGAPVYPLPLGQPDPAIVEPQLAEISAEHDRIYALFWGAEQRDPQRVVERWLDAHAFKASEEWVGDVRFVVYAVPSAPATEMAQPLDAGFGEAITLDGMTLQNDALSPGEIVQVTLFWTSAEVLSQRYKVFLHVVDANGNVVAQRDSEPGGGLLPTVDWQIGEQVHDNHGILLPSDLPAGDYSLVLGLYDAADPLSRLPLDSGGDSLTLATIRVEE